uniref:Peptidase C39 family protein n=1 Tax=Candidatus Kentrum sp. TC TaxID=2126339 RepID=A0A450YLB2_9GAMM|nr:MAG: Peptidase C39 family protein [Candidatus Kentron sp. TC]
MPFESPPIRILFLFLVGLSIGFPALAEDRESLLFKEVTRQSHDYSCGPAALSTLINGAIPGQRVSELEVISTREKSEDGNEEGFSLLDLKAAAGKLGHGAQWKKIKPEFLPMLSQPVILLIGLNSPFPHFVILKGFRDGEAFLADPTRGNVRVPYADLKAEGLSEKYPAWYVMAIHIPADAGKASFLYLSETDPASSHFTIAQSDAITLTTVAKRNQVLLTYGYRLSQGRDGFFDGMTVKSRGESHRFDIGYGIAEDTELGAGFGYSNTTFAVSGYSDVESSDRSSYVSISRDFDLGAMKDMGVLVGSSLSHGDRSESLHAELNALLYGSTDHGQWMAGGSFYKKLKEKSGYRLPKYGVSWLLGFNKPLSDRSLGSFHLNMYTDRNDGDFAPRFDHSYSANASLSWTMNKKIQLRSSVEYSFGARVMKTFSAGMDVIYVGGW